MNLKLCRGQKNTICCYEVLSYRYVKNKAEFSMYLYVNVDTSNYSKSEVVLEIKFEEVCLLFRELFCLHFLCHRACKFTFGSPLEKRNKQKL